MKMMNLLETCDLDLAAYLYARTYPLLGVWNLGELTIYAFPHRGIRSYPAGGSAVAPRGFRVSRSQAIGAVPLPQRGAGTRR